MKQIGYLVNDIYQLVQRKDGWFNETISQELGDEVAGRVRRQFESKKKPTLRLSQMGPRCPKALWHSIHTPTEAEPLPPWAELKYLYGHLIEAQTIALAKAAGHEVTGEQYELELNGIVGHRDCIIDGCTVDVKSASSFSFAKFKSQGFENTDTFGYLDQLDGYALASLNDSLVTVKDRAYILAVDKQLGHMFLYEHRITDERKLRLYQRIEEFKKFVECPSPPLCCCKTIPEGAAGNIRLDTKASYSPFKHCCFPSLRTFLYASGPVYLSRVVRKPDVKEINRYGQTVH